MRFNTILMLGSLGVVVPTVAIADVITVDDDGPADFSTIQAAVDAASNGDEILVYEGVYLPTEATAVVNLLGKSVWLHSAGSVSNTIIDGAGMHQGILCINGETNTTRIEGFTIQNCSSAWNDLDGDGEVDYWEHAGGGMVCGSSIPTILNCHFTNNFSNGDGGGMFNYMSNPTLTNCDFEFNTANGNGSGIANRTSSPYVNGCNFSQNNATLGGGMYNYDGSSPSFTGCAFLNNSAEFGGGIYNRFFSQPTFSKCMFEGNSAEHGGGAMFSSSFSNTISTSSIFMDNYTTDSDSIAGAIGNSNSSPTLTGCEFYGNSAMHRGGALYCAVGSQADISGCSFEGNEADNGGGVYFEFFSDAMIESTSFRKNTGHIDGAALYVIDYCNLELDNITMIGNTSPSATVWSSNFNTIDIADCTMEYNSLELLGLLGTSIKISGTNAIARIMLEDVSTELELVASASLTMLAELSLHGASLQFDVDALDAPAPINSNGVFLDGSLCVTNTSGSLATSSIGDMIALIDSSGIDEPASMVLPAMPAGLGLQLPSGEDLVIHVVEAEAVQLDDPLLTELDNVPVDLEVLDVNNDGQDELAVLYGGSPGTLVVYEMTADAEPMLLPNLTTTVGNAPVDMDVGDANNDGNDDLVIANADDDSVTLLTASDAVYGTSVFSSKTIQVPSTNQKPTSVAFITWNNNELADIVVGIDKLDEFERDTLKVIMDVGSSHSPGPLFEIPKFEYAGVEYPDVPRVADGYISDSDGSIESGFIVGTRYGNVFKANNSSGALTSIGALNGRNISSLEVIDIDDNGGDGQLDVLIGSDEGEMIHILQGNVNEPNGFEIILLSIDISAKVSDLYATDIDGDDDTDFVVTAPESEEYFVLVNGGSSSNLMPGGLDNRSWNKQDLPSSNTPDKVDGGALDEKDEDDDWMSGSGSGSGLLGTPGTMEQTNIGSTESDRCSGDFNADGNINVNDLLILIAAWGPCEGCAQDLNGDGAVNVNDLLVLIAAWGPCSP